MAWRLVSAVSRRVSVATPFLDLWGWWTLVMRGCLDQGGSGRVGGSGVGMVLPGASCMRVRAVLMPQVLDSKTLGSNSAQRAMLPWSGWSGFLEILVASLAVAIWARVSRGGRFSSCWRASIPVPSGTPAMTRMAARWTLVRILRVFLVAPDRNWMPYSRVERTVAVYICLRMCACTPVRLAITFMTSSLLWALRARCFA